MCLKGLVALSFSQFAQAKDGRRNILLFWAFSVTQGRGQSGRVLQDCAVRRRDLLTEAKETYVTKD